MKRVSALTIALATCIAAQSVWSEESSNVRKFLFMSGSIEAQVKKKFYAIEQFDGKRIQAKGMKKPIKPTGAMNCSLKPEMVVSEFYAEIREIDFEVDSNADRLREMMAVNEMNAEQMRYEAGADFESARARMNGASTLERTRNKEDKISTLDTLTKDQIENGIGQLNPDRLFDNLRGDYTLVTNVSLENAYIATLVTFDGVNAKPKVGGRKETIVRFTPVGNVVAKESMTVNFDFEFPEITASSAKLEFFLFDGSGEPIATNQSRGLQLLDAAQLEEFYQLKKAGKI